MRQVLGIRMCEVVMLELFFLVSCATSVVQYALSPSLPPSPSASLNWE